MDKLGGLQMELSDKRLSIGRYFLRVIGCSERAWVHCWESEEEEEEEEEEDGGDALSSSLGVIIN
jgi:hypothetical protein